MAERALSLSLLVLLGCCWARLVRSCSCLWCGLGRTGVSLCRLALLLGWEWGWVAAEARLGAAEESWFWAWTARGGAAEAAAEAAAAAAAGTGTGTGTEVPWRERLGWEEVEVEAGVDWLRDGDEGSLGWARAWRLGSS